MKNYKFTLSVFVSLLLLLSACNFPRASSELSLDEQAATIVAMTLKAQIKSTSTPENTPLPTPTLALTKTPTPTITPTYSIPLLKVNEPTNCRTGPGQSYDIIIALLPGASVEIVGRYPTNNYWTVKVQGLDQPCWVWGEYSTTSGSTWAVPTVNPPPTVTASPPTAPSLPSDAYAYNCNFNNITVSIKWNDRADNEQGYRIYRNNEMIVELPANSTLYTDTIVEGLTGTISYGIAAYNITGESGRTSFSFSCQ